MAADPGLEDDGLPAPRDGPGSRWRDALRRAASEPDAPTREIVLIVHGTFANPGYPEPPSAACWWSPRGSFGTALDAALARHGSPARCSLGLDEWLRIGTRDQLRPRWHGWSGANSEVERRRGAFALARIVRDYQADASIAKIHIVAHSHGGNVVRRALRYLNNPSAKLGRVICLGTPFLHFDDAAAWRRWLAKVHWPMAGVIAAVLSSLHWGSAWFEDPADPLPALLVAAALLAAIVSMWRYARRTEASTLDLPMTALRFANDEAIQLLRSCAALAAQPHLFLRDMLGGAAAPARRRPCEAGGRPRYDWFDRASAVAEWVLRLGTNTIAVLSDFWNGPLCRAGEWLTSRAYRLWLLGTPLGSLGTLLLLMSFRPYRPPLRPFLSSRMPRLRDQFFHSMDDVVAQQREAIVNQLPPGVSRRGPFGERAPHARASAQRGPMESVHDFVDQELLQLQSARTMVALGPVLIYGLLFYPVDLLLGLPAWLAAVMTRFSILLGARAAAASAPGMDILGAAFQARRTGEPPNQVSEIVIGADIERQLEQRLDAAVRVNLAPLRLALDPARRLMLLEALKTVFNDPAMLHAHYYQEEAIVDRVAELIAGERVSAA